MISIRRLAHFLQEIKKVKEKNEFLKGISTGPPTDCREADCVSLNVEPTNNRAERHLRPSVIMRKITFGNRSESGAKNHPMIMSILQTSKVATKMAYTAIKS
ncbi:MAG TPA: hypothetical protein EYP24_05245 [bacterium (Candidatus Stahlbacteria)]|nr:hypothetical protein [Candidatus Stahlbacteria bacterium]